MREHVRTDLSYNDFTTICRICLLKDTELQSFEVHLLEIYKLLVKVEDEFIKVLPQNICKICSKQLEDISLFIDTCKNNEEDLKTIYLQKGITTCIYETSDDESERESNFELSEDDAKTEKNTTKKRKASKTENSNKKSKTKNEIKRELRKKEKTRHLP
ncbi:hypothetical protein NQ317_019744 [Molorchus minor]|uniref:ZAD domain-containing protein n=1 Tax=Molorchus minor TaxID=1323400 RepID=A0ABQ9K4T0_9CUCU|nr:hypothetical protein NQ317_019744 [Molorchus minor]